MVTAGIIEMDCHGLTVDQAIRAIEEKVNHVPMGTYRIRVIHGYNHGTRIRDSLRDELRYNSKIIRIEGGSNLGITELILKEYY